MSRALTVCALVAAAWPPSAMAQSTWGKVIEPEDELTVRDMVPTEGRGFLGTGPWYAFGGSVVSGGWAARVRSDGEPRWAASVDLPQLPGYNEPSLVAIDETTDGGAIALGPVQNLHGGMFREPLGTWLVKLDDDGERQWSVEVGAAQHVGVVGHDVAATSDGGCVVVGSAHDLSQDGNPQFGYAVESNRLWVARLSAQGDVQWSHRVGALDQDGALVSCRAQSVVVTASGRIAVLGRTLTATAEGKRAWGVWLVLLDPAGELLTQRAAWADLGEEDSNVPLNWLHLPVQLAELPDGGFVATTVEWGYPHDERAFLMRFDKDLKAQLMVGYAEMPPTPVGTRVHELRAYPLGTGRIALAGTVRGAGRRAWIAEVDGALRPVWQRTFETEVEDRALVVVEQQDTVLGPSVVLGDRGRPVFDTVPSPWSGVGLWRVLTLMIPAQKYLVGGSSGLGSTGSERSLFALRLDDQGQLEGECPRFPDRDVDAIEIRVFDATPEVEVEGLALTVGPLDADVDPLDLAAIRICPLAQLPDAPIGVVLPPPCVPGPPGWPFFEGAPSVPGLPWCQHEIGCLVCVPRLARERADRQPRVPGAALRRVPRPRPGERRCDRGVRGPAHRRARGARRRSRRAVLRREALAGGLERAGLDPRGSRAAEGRSGGLRRPRGPGPRPRPTRMEGDPGARGPHDGRRLRGRGPRRAARREQAGDARPARRALGLRPCRLRPRVAERDPRLPLRRRAGARGLGRRSPVRRRPGGRGAARRAAGPAVGRNHVEGRHVRRGRAPRHAHRAGGPPRPVDPRGSPPLSRHAVCPKGGPAQRRGAAVAS